MVSRDGAVHPGNGFAPLVSWMVECDSHTYDDEHGLKEDRLRNRVEKRHLEAPNVLYYGLMLRSQRREILR